MSMDTSSSVGNNIGARMVSRGNGGRGKKGRRLRGFFKGDGRASDAKDSAIAETSATGGVLEAVNFGRARVMPRPIVVVVGTVTFCRMSERKTGGRREDKSIGWGRAAASNLGGRWSVVGLFERESEWADDSSEEERERAKA